MSKIIKAPKKTDFDKQIEKRQKQVLKTQEKEQKAIDDAFAQRIKDREDAKRGSDSQEKSDQS